MSQINRFPCPYPVVTLVPRYTEDQLISAVNIKSAYGITIHVIIKNETSCWAISRNWHLKFCIVTLSPRKRRLYIHVVSCKSIMVMIMIICNYWITLGMIWRIVEKAEVDNTLKDLHKSSDDEKPNPGIVLFSI